MRCQIFPSGDQSIGLFLYWASSPCTIMVMKGNDEDWPLPLKFKKRLALP